MSKAASDEETLADQLLREQFQRLREADYPPTSGLTKLEQERWPDKTELTALQRRQISFVDAFAREWLRTDLRPADLQDFKRVLQKLRRSCWNVSFELRINLPLEEIGLTDALGVTDIGEGLLKMRSYIGARKATESKANHPGAWGAGRTFSEWLQKVHDELSNAVASFNSNNFAESDVGITTLAATFESLAYQVWDLEQVCGLDAQLYSPPQRRKGAPKKARLAKEEFRKAMLPMNHWERAKAIVEVLGEPKTKEIFFPGPRDGDSRDRLVEELSEKIRTDEDKPLRE